VAFEVLKREPSSLTETTTTNVVALPEVKIPPSSALPVLTPAPSPELPKIQPAVPLEKETTKLIKRVEEPASKPVDSIASKPATVITNSVPELKNDSSPAEPKKEDPLVVQNVIDDAAKPSATKTIAEKPLSTKTISEDAGPILPKEATKVAASAPVPDPLPNAAATPVPPPVVPRQTAPITAVPELKPKEIGEIPQAEKSEEPTFVKRVVRREGLVRNALSIQAPSPFELVNPETHKPMDYLHGEKSGITVKHFKGQRVIVTGEEGIDPRWPNTPVLEIETIDSAP
jgi:hypothetical protein